VSRKKHVAVHLSVTVTNVGRFLFHSFVVVLSRRNV